MKVAFFHGLESSHITDKSKYLSEHYDLYAPKMNYKDPSLFNRTLQEIKNQGIQFLIGSSMGGWFSYCLSTQTGLPTILFNPAVHSRKIEPFIKLGNIRGDHTVILGRRDDVIDAYKTEDWFEENCQGTFNIDFYNFGHRTPIGHFSIICDSVLSKHR
jgi:uncharacterized protein